MNAKYNENMRQAGQAAAKTLEFISPYIAAGVSLKQLDYLCHEYITKNLNAIPACLNYLGFPNSVCISVNDVVCHGIPNEKQLKNGDILNIDVTVLLNGVHGDTSCMFFVGTPSIQAKRLCKVTQTVLYEAIKKVRPGVCLSVIGQTIEPIVLLNGYSVVRDYCGHFIGKSFHERPDVLHHASADNDFILKPGMTFTIEPMVNVGKSAVRIMPDKWTVRTKDRSLSAQYEHTILVTETGYEILTLRSDETISRFG